MLAPPLPAHEVARLPTKRPRWLCHVAAATFVAVTVVVGYGGRDLARTSWLGEWLEEGPASDLLEAMPMTLVGVLLLPAFGRVSFRKRDWLFFFLVPLWGLVIAWKVGFRLTSLPYRDWPPRPDEVDRARRVPGTMYHVVLPEPSAPSHGEPLDAPLER